MIQKNLTLEFLGNKTDIGNNIEPKCGTTIILKWMLFSVS